MAAHPEAPERQATTASPLDRHDSPVSDRPAAAGRTRHGRATAALIVSLIGLVFSLILFWPLGVVLGIIGAVLGATARNDIKRRGMVGSGQATAALVLGIIAVALPIVLIAIGAIVESN